MALKFTPEPIKKLQQRFYKAIQPIWDANEINDDPEADRPGLHRNHVFDCEDGIRLIISKDKIGGFKNGVGTPEEKVIHFSCSFTNDKYKELHPEKILQLCRDRFMEISDNVWLYKLVAVSKAGVPHFIASRPFNNPQLLN